MFRKIASNNCAPKVCENDITKRGMWIHIFSLKHISFLRKYKNISKRPNVWWKTRVYFMYQKCTFFWLMLGHLLRNQKFLIRLGYYLKLILTSPVWIIFLKQKPGGLMFKGSKRHGGCWFESKPNIKIKKKIRDGITVLRRSTINAMRVVGWDVPFQKNDIAARNGNSALPRNIFLMVSYGYKTAICLTLKAKEKIEMCRALPLSISKGRDHRYILD